MSMKKRFSRLRTDSMRYTEKAGRTEAGEKGN